MRYLLKLSIDLHILRQTKSFRKSTHEKALFSKKYKSVMVENLLYRIRHSPYIVHTAFLLTKPTFKKKAQTIYTYGSKDIHKGIHFSLININISIP